MRYQPYYTLSALFEQAIVRWSERPFAQFVDGSLAYTYGDLEDKVAMIIRMLGRYGVDVSEKIVILGENTPNWAVAFFAVTTSGRVAVPVLPGSSESEIGNILLHSGAKAIFVSGRLCTKMLGEVFETLPLVVSLDDFSVLRGTVKFPSIVLGDRPDPDSLAAIIYTSGTSGSPKGVMLSHLNLCHNVWAAYKAQRVNHHDRWLSILPLAHTYELALGLLLPVFAGGSIYYLSGLPTQTVLLPAMKTVRPSLMMSVPLVIEKIYKSIWRKVEAEKFLSWMRRHTPALLDLLLGLRLHREMGGCLKFFGIGGAKLDPAVESFLARAHFPYAIGYGMTEAAPLICNAAVGKTFVGSVGVPAYGVEVRLREINPSTGEGEVIVRGPNVMLGYYKDPERTASALSQDGWLRTGDIAARDRKGRFHLTGRLKNVILGPSGENIYPEEIEQVIDSYPGVDESLVIERGRRLVALVHLEDGLKEALPELAHKIRSFANQRLSAFSAVSLVEFVREPFQKTATAKIKRFLYTRAEPAR